MSFVLGYEVYLVDPRHVTLIIDICIHAAHAPFLFPRKAKPCTSSFDPVQR